MDYQDLQINQMPRYSEFVALRRDEKSTAALLSEAAPPVILKLPVDSTKKFSIGSVTFEGGLVPQSNLRANFYETSLRGGRLTIGAEFAAMPLVSKYTGRYIDADKSRAGLVGLSITYHFSWKSDGKAAFAFPSQASRTRPQCLYPDSNFCF